MLRLACVALVICFAALGVENVLSHQHSLNHQVEYSRKLQMSQDLRLMRHLVMSMRGAATSLLTVTEKGDTSEIARLNGRIATMSAEMRATPLLSMPGRFHLSKHEADMVSRFERYVQGAEAYAVSPNETDLKELIGTAETLTNSADQLVSELEGVTLAGFEAGMHEQNAIHQTMTVTVSAICLLILFPVLRAAFYAVNHESQTRELLELNNEQLEAAQAVLTGQNEELETQRAKLQEALDHAENQKAMHDHASRRFQSLFAGLPVGCMTFDGMGTVMEWNRQMSEIFGIETHRALLAPVQMVLGGSPNAGDLGEVVHRVAMQGEEIEFEWCFDHESGPRYVSMVWFPLKDPNGNPVGGIGCAVDVTERKRAEEKVEAANARVRATLESIRDNFFSCDHEGRFTYVNDSAVALIGVPEEVLIGAPVWDYCRGTDWIPIRSLLDRAVNGQETSVGEYFFSGLNCYFEFRMYPSMGGASVFFQDVTERTMFQRQLEDKNAELEEAKLQLEISESELRKANEKFRNLASTDGLTGLNNHRTFQEFLQLQFESAEMLGGTLAVALMDVDKFKQYNDSFGHPAGDQVLKGVAQVLKDVVPSPHFVARYGGEEFVIVMVGLDEVEALSLVEEIRYEIEGRDWPHREVTASFGVSFLAPETKDRQWLIAEADEALYASKESGRNRVTAWNWLETGPPKTEAA